MEVEKQLEKQRAIEQEREEQRRKAMEQKEVISVIGFVHILESLEISNKLFSMPGILVQVLEGPGNLNWATYFY